ncbi:MAG: DNA gyrase C-terminal beta-propeller domain-containing protein, partial [Pseudomonadota bacterium]
PYQVNKANLIIKIADLVKEKRIEGIATDGLRDESDKDGMRIVVELRRGEVSEVILNNLYKHTAMQSVFGINMVALVDGQPRLLNLKQILQAFIRHRRDVVTRRTIFELRKARERAHILEGQAVALTNIDEIIALIKKSESPAVAKEKLIAKAWKPGVVTKMLDRAGAGASKPEDLDPSYGMHKGEYHLSPTQAQAILDLRLHRLTGLEQDKIVNDYGDLLEKIIDLLEILQDPERLLKVIREELEEVRDQYGDERRTEINDAQADLTMEDLIPEENVVVTLSHAGYAKSQPLDTYRAQRRGGRGKAATSVKAEDFVDQLFVANTHDTILCFSSRGKVYWLKVYALPQAGRTARGKPIVNLLPLQEDERINVVLPVKEYRDDAYVVMLASSGTVKKTKLTEFSRPRASGILAVDLRENDRLIDVAVTNGNTDLLLVTSAGKAIRFKEDDVRAMGRNATGVRGIKMGEGQQVISLITITDDMSDKDVLVASEKGYGKRTPMNEYPVQKRGGQGVIAIQTSGRNGDVVGAVAVTDEDEIMLITDSGTLVRTPVEDVSQMGRNTQGVRLIRLSEEERLVEVERIENLSHATEIQIEDND